MRERAVNCFISAAQHMKGPPGYMTSAAFSNLRWTLAGDQRDERMRLFCRKFLNRLDAIDTPFYPSVGLMDHKTAVHRAVTGLDPWVPMENPYLDGTAINFRHCIHAELPKHCWALFAEIGFDCARLAQIPVVWGGWPGFNRPGHFELYDGNGTSGPPVDRRTYGVRSGGRFDYDLGA